MNWLPRCPAAPRPWPPTTHPPSTTGAGLGAWITNDPLDTATLTQLSSDGYSQVILPPASVSSSPTDGSAAEAFSLPGSRGTTMTAMASNGDLASRFTSPSGDPVLAAHQLVAELSQIYYEKPNDATPRAVAVVAPNDWAPDPAFVAALLGALAGNPIIQPVTTSGLFDAVGTPVPCRPDAGWSAGPPAPPCRWRPSGPSANASTASPRPPRAPVTSARISATWC